MDMCIYRYMDTPLGAIIVAARGEAVCGLWFEGQKYERAGLPADAVCGDAPVLDAAEAWLERYFAGQQPGDMPPLELSGSAFKRAVMEEMLSIPRGQTTTYGEIAQRLRGRGFERACARAVGTAVGHNPISIFVPCHRVLGAGGALTGYAGGLERKRFLLELEGAAQKSSKKPGKK